MAHDALGRQRPGLRRGPSVDGPSPIIPRPRWRWPAEFVALGRNFAQARASPRSCRTTASRYPRGGSIVRSPGALDGAQEVRDVAQELQELGRLAEPLALTLAASAGNVATMSPRPDGHDDDRASPRDAAAGASLNDVFVAQQMSQWCWAATLVIVKRCLGTVAPPQCEIVNVGLGRRDCCGGNTVMCNAPYVVSQLATLYQKFTVTCRPLWRMLTEDELVAELSQRRPVAVCVAWTGAVASYHLLAVVGFRRRKSGLVFDVADPWKGKRTIRFDVLQQAYGVGAWRWSWIDFAECAS